MGFAIKNELQALKISTELTQLLSLSFKNPTPYIFIFLFSFFTVCCRLNPKNDKCVIKIRQLSKMSQNIIFGHLTMFSSLNRYFS